jgi:hypothetical protein
LDGTYRGYLAATTYQHGAIRILRVTFTTRQQFRNRTGYATRMVERVAVAGASPIERLR